MSERVIVESLNARMLLGAMMLSEPDAAKALGLLRLDAMVGHERTVLDAVRDLNDHAQGCALPLVIEYLQAHEMLVELGGAAEVCSWVDCRLPSESVAGLCGEVNNAALRRELQRAGRDITAEANNPPWVDEALEFAENRIASLHAPRSDRPQSVGEIMREMAERPPLAIPTGFTQLDHLLDGGLRPGQLVVIGGRPAMGKTCLAVALADRVALSGARVLLVSAEMSKQELVTDRLRRLHSGGIPDGLAIEILSSVKLGEVRSAMMRLRPALVIVDYLQLMHGKGDKRYERVDYVARSLKHIAGEFAVPVVVVAACNRGPEEGGKIRVPVLSDLREGGEIEYAADIVAFIHRPKPYEPGNDEASLHVVKQRNGTPGIIPLRFIRASATFVEVSSERPELASWGDA